MDLFSDGDPQSLAGKDILEIGPGMLIEPLALAANFGARTCIAVDIRPYLDGSRLREMSIQYRLYDGIRLPLPDGSVDLAWAAAVLQHVRYPAVTVREISRVLRKGGRLICQLDLRDPYNLSDETRWNDFLVFSERVWRAMKWNRASYSNRLRASEWLTEFRKAGLTPISMRARRSETLALQRGRRFCRAFSDDDLATFGFEGIARKE